MKRPWLAVISLGVMGFNLSGCERSGGCTMASCASGATIELMLPQATWSLMRTWKMTICKNDVCASGAMSDLPVTNPNGAGYDFRVTGASAPDRITAVVREDGSLTVNWYSENTRTGDRYVVEVSDSLGTRIASLDRVATYTKTAPNGEACGPICQQATLN